MDNMFMDGDNKNLIKILNINIQLTYLKLQCKMHNKLCMIEFHVPIFIKLGKMMEKENKDILNQE